LKIRKIRPHLTGWLLLLLELTPFPSGIYYDIGGTSVAHCKVYKYKVFSTS
jgi:hypothetical protein